MAVSIDDNVQVGLELSTSALRLSGRALIAIMDMFLDQDKRNNHYRDLKPETKQGKQAVKELFAKYENTEVQALDGNLSKEEIKSIKKELNSMGVDFSIKKIEKDNYSLFFAGKDIEAIEKGMSNAIIKHLNKRNQMKNIKNILFDVAEKRNVVELDNNIEDEVIEDELIKIIDNPESIKDSKIEEFSKPPTEKQLRTAKKFGIEDFNDMNRIEISLALQEASAEKSLFNEKEVSTEKTKGKAKGKKGKGKPKFNIKDMQKEHIEKKKKERTQTKEKVRNKKPKRSL